MKKTSLLILLTLFAVWTQAQQDSVTHWDACTSAQENNKDVPSGHPYALELKKLETKIKQTKSGTSTYIIPVVFHIVDQDPNKVTDGQIASAMQILNEDFSGTNADIIDVATYFKSVQGSLSIEFKLAKIDPLGNATTGIDRVTANGICNNTSGGLGNMASNCPVKITAPAWDTHRYLNVWIINDVYGGTTNSTNSSGWAFRSGSVPNIDEGEDGIVYNHKFLGTEGSSEASSFLGDMTRVFTHEVGHYLNLYHTHTGWCGGGDDDFIADTPPVKYNNCGSCCPEDVNNPSDYYKSCDGVTPINVQNFMAYSGCTLMFTKDQQVRMEASLQSSVRNNLWTEENLFATGLKDDLAFVSSVKSSRKVEVFPNPFSDQITLSFDAGVGESSIQVRRISGELVKEIKNTFSSNVQLDLSSEEAGMYLIILVTGEGQTQPILVTKK